MPPTSEGEPLTPAQIDVLRAWIENGAPYELHWSYVPPHRAVLPDVSDPPWCRNAIDRFVLSRLDREHLSPSEEADRCTLVRRVSIDLTGLPPTPQEVEAFVLDRRPGAYERLVDRLLASPAFGERWARVWLDLARYADSAGYADDPPRVIWMYRDWVVAAMNANEPFDQFTIDQIAGDLLPDPTDDQLIATAFHRNTMTNSEGGTDDEEFRNVAVVDRVNTTFQVWMATTIGCAQCHSHKFDPISQEEFYRVFAILNQTADADRRDETPTLSLFTAEQQGRQTALQAQIAAVEADLSARAQQLRESADPADDGAGQGELSTRYVRIELPGNDRFLSLAEVQVFTGDENIARQGTASQSSTAYDGPAELAIDGNTDGHFFNAQSTTHTEQSSDPWWELDLGEAHHVDRIVVWNRTDSEGIGSRLNGFRLVLLDAARRAQWVHVVATAAAVDGQYMVPASFDGLAEDDRLALAEYRAGNSPELQQLRQRRDELQAQLAAVQPITTPVMKELPPEEHRPTHIQIRGNFLDLGPEVQPGVPAAFHPLKGDTADRLALARWLVDRDNPLTARVVVNRYWEQLFGRGLVITSEDFGMQGEPPSHPELLDWLAIEFMEGPGGERAAAWDVKALVRLIVTSATYRQSSDVTPELAAQDRDNRLLSRGPRLRLSAEAVRDQALSVSGLLSRKMEGPSVYPPRPKLGLTAAFGGSTDWDTSSGEDRYRRGLYTFWRRSIPYPSMDTFDAPSREVCTLRRIPTNTPLQALVTLNDPVFVEAAQSLARRILREGGATTAERISFAFRLCVSRPPTATETARLEESLAAAAALYLEQPDAAVAMATDPLGPLPAEADPVEAAAWTVLSNVLLNLDETLTRR
jgi:Protein of unknown function (DUF1553)/Protein of unknown function (DUF1549)/NedA-like, galactose-binding domain